MRPLTTIVLLFLLLGVVGYILLFQKDAATPPPDQIPRLIPAFQPSSVKSLELSNASGTYEFERRRDGGWNMIAPTAGRADPAALDAMLSKLEFLETVRELGSDNPEYGLDEPRARLNLRAADGASTFEISVGKEGALRQNVWVRVTGAETSGIFVVEKGIFEVLDRSADDFRDRTLMTMRGFEVEKVGLQIGDRVFFASKGATSWLIEKPFVARGDLNRIRAVLNAVLNLEIEEFVADAVTDWKPYGLDEPSIGFLVEDGQGRREALTLGSVNESGHVHVRRNDETSVYGVPQAVLARLDLQVDDLRDPRVLPGGAADVSEITVERDGAPRLRLVRDARDENIWTLERGGEEAPAAEFEIDRLVDLVASLDCEEFVPPGTVDLAAVGLTNPAIHATFRIPTHDEVLEILVGNSIPDRNLYYVKNGTEAQAFLVAADRLAPLLRPGYEYRTKSLLAFDENEVISVSVTYGEESVRFEESGDADNRVWTRRSGSGEAGPVNRTEMILFLSEFSSLQAEEFVTDDLSRLGEHQLDPPGATLTLRYRESGNGEAEPEERKLLLSDTEGQSLHYGVLEGLPLIYSTKRDMSREIEKLLRRTRRE